MAQPLRVTGNRSRPAGGSVVLHAVIGLLVLMFLAVTLLAISRSIMDHSMRQVREAQALAAAEGACSRGIAMLEAGAITSLPYTETDTALGGQTMDLSIVALESGVVGASGAQRYEIRGTGHAGNIQRTVALGGANDSFLSYSRFLGNGGLGYNGGATLTGRVYCGGDLTLSGSPVTFMEDVTTTTMVVNKEQGVYHSDVTEYASPITLEGSMEVDYYRGLATAAGMYFGSGVPEIDLDLFDFTGSEPTYNGTGLGANFNGIVFAENDLDVKGVLQGRSLTLVATDDVLINDHVRTGCSQEFHDIQNPPFTLDAPHNNKETKTLPLNGMLHGIGNSVKLTVSGSTWQRLNLYVREDGDQLGVATIERHPRSDSQETTILSGLHMDPGEHTYTAQVDFWSDGSGSNPAWVEVSGGDPVNLGLLAQDHIYIDQYTPRVLIVDAALFSRNKDWRPTDHTDGSDWDNSHPSCSGTWDLNEDGQIETNNADGYNEQDVSTDAWTLNINGPIITKNAGSAGAWSYQGELQGKGTRHYNYDEDVVHYQPPFFPVMPSGWTLLYWREAT